MGIFDCFNAAAADTTSVYSPSEATQASDQAKNRDTPVNVHWDENTSPTKQFGIGYSHSPRKVDAYIRPVIHCRLKGKAELTSATEGLDLLAPRDEESSLTRFKPHEEKYPSVVLCVPTSCNESALTAWGVSSTQQLQTRLRNICMADTSFLNLLSTVAMSVVAPTVLQQSEGACVMMYRPSPSTSNLIPGGCNIRLSGTFMREDVEDFSFFPFLILELDQPDPEPLSLLTMHYEAQDEKLINLLLTSLSRVEPSANLKSGPNENVGNPAPSSSLQPGMKTSLISTKEQDALARSFAMISSVPCIATLLELRPVGNPSLDQVEGEDRSTAFQGCILMQNQLSISYWGELSTNHPQGSWLLLMELFKEEPTTIMELINKIEREKRKQGGLLLSTSGKEEGCWKKAIQVPASGQHLAARLSDDAQKQRLKMYHQARSSNSGSILPVSVLSDTGPQPAVTDTSPPGLKSSLNTAHLGSKSGMAADERLGSPSGSFAIFGPSSLQRRSFCIPVTSQAQPLSPTLATGPQENTMEDV
ncbi:hypothetical protein CEUSTIGMA_g2047.t1 [Chlamydomonas eustigma]|uniref:Uncharacterized protein n=1 Tax=Chlamydomonas eustigma TaxID=1157962 RepID=A0A250WV63_9CHLO|nr:hypothetical protein CEUSTIGMA_g2047.t1 [Chlamydomonas eustigma]|eukprot:GAX74599.1 hypothetical protein CEUSTIGMA_g2047.t1 [Chlamydomonas eustigma]